MANNIILNRITIERDASPADPRKNYEHMSTIMRSSALHRWAWGESTIRRDCQPEWFDGIASNCIESVGLSDAYNEAMQYNDDTPVEQTIKRALSATHVVYTLHFSEQTSELSLGSPIDQVNLDDYMDGVIYISIDTLAKEFTDKSADELKTIGLEIIKAELNSYSHYLQGEVYGYVIEQRKHMTDSYGTVYYTEWAHEDSCFGFEGPDHETSGLFGQIRASYPGMLEDGLESDGLTEVVYE
jgi:hypothetical protein